MLRAYKREFSMNVVRTNCAILWDWIDFRRAYRDIFWVENDFDFLRVFLIFLTPLYATGFWLAVSNCADQFRLDLSLEQTLAGGSGIAMTRYGSGVGLKISISY